ncbi:MAG TPA: sigma-70 family RNA polymerase sigma factor [Bryobacteraceae bacterium]|nr:sigma-70 family RNA polymerase sigma factor [Bryobacteraceae bacterium]HOQ45889.1 sigma-70 family RNA polymerase sigma factor [Bryobacteraceae bacterium]HPQ14526.1 sigma-70 family RNA polymerase sigma factor [Bryobacteraceae bacterium]HPU73292.1 sigma-70 family RNA polymerase sigma factor [Bryobacteraceae bacterium]
MSTGAPTVSTPAAELEAIFQAHSSRVYRIARRITGDAGDAEDVLQTVFLKMLRRGWESASVKHLESYLHRTAVNAALDVLRARRTAAAAPLEEAAFAQDPRLQPDRQNDVRELRAGLRAAVARLAPRSAEIFALRYFEGYGNQEIAQMLGTTPSDVAITLHRARVKLQQELRSYLGETS